MYSPFKFLQTGAAITAMTVVSMAQALGDFSPNSRFSYVKTEDGFDLDCTSTQ